MLSRVCGLDGWLVRNGFEYAVASGFVEGANIIHFIFVFTVPSHGHGIV